jgi:hypothetical protein
MLMYDVWGEMRNANKILVGKSEGKTSSGRPRSRGEDNIKLCHKGTGCDIVH